MIFRRIICAILPFFNFCDDDDDVGGQGNPTPPTSPPDGENPTPSPPTGQAPMGPPIAAPITTARPTLRPSQKQVYNFECPAIGSSETFSLPNFEVVTLAPIASGLCTLSLEEGEGNYIPIARSYDGNDWERAGGRFVANWAEWECDNGACTNSLPAGEKYVIRTREVTSTADKEKARFLEAASFGPTRESMQDTTSTFSEYIERQMAMPVSSHREFFRRNTNPVWEFHHPKFAASLDPCTINSTWRRQLISEKDFKKTLQVNKVGDRWQVSIDGHVRGMQLQFRFENKYPWMDDEIEDGGSYKLCSWIPGDMRRGRYRVENREGRCRYLMTEDVMAIDFPDGFVPEVALTGTLPSLSDGLWQSLSDFVPEYRYQGTIPAEQCSSDTRYSYNGAPVFAKTADNHWVIFDSRIIIKENTLEKPLSDGGYSDFAAGRTLGCANSPRSFLNEASCVMAPSMACPAQENNLTMSTTGLIVCGSPGEVANVATVKDSWLDMTSVNGDFQGTGLPIDKTPQWIFKRQREFIWSEMVLKSEDQLRQRVAWALSQTFALPVTAVGGEGTRTEMFLYYYDIFLRHGFGNYGDILKEITYNTLMAESLSFQFSKSVALNHLWFGVLEYPDENFARELMQLFTIGLVELDLDGSPVLDDNGKKISTYDSEDVMSFARAWTGFEPYSGYRTNTEGLDSRNKFDPMNIVAEYRDRFPKTDLGGGYIGDGYPLCADLPEKHFLLKGAKYRLLGTSPVPELIEDDERWAASTTAKRLELSSGSALYDELVGYQGVVVLDRSLACNGNECNVDTVRVVKVNDVFYEHVRTPCVEQSYIENAQTIAVSARWNRPMCANPLAPVAGEACCEKDELRGNATVNCMYAGERMTMSTATQRCAAMGKEVCHYREILDSEQCPQEKYYRWTSQPCQQQVKVNDRGYAAIVHDVTTDYTPPPFLRTENPSFFRVYWKDGAFPSPSNSCGNGLCPVVDNACLCNVAVSDIPAFASLPSGPDEILNQLKVGNADPALYGGKYQKSAGSGFFYHHVGGGCCDIDTVYEVKDHNEITRFLKNVKSTVTVSGSSFAFRNAPTFNSLIPSEYSVADAQHETDSVLGYLLHHKNTPPFVAYRLIQRFGISNPSPRYVRAVAVAFQKGIYTDGGTEFGTNTYGDLAATVAAVLLDREARSPSVTHDPSYGSLREPIVKVIGFMRAVEFQSSLPLVELHEMNEKVGEMAFSEPSVFSFFRPEYSPNGVAASAQLVAPESEVMSSGKVVGLLNGLFSLVKSGLQKCEYGFGAYEDCEDEPGGVITYDSTIEELSMLLTGGRLNDEKLAAISQAVNQTDPAANFRQSVQLLATTPEFHTTNKPDLQAEKAAGGSQSAGEPPETGYKAVIHLFLDGGCDSFNVLTPHPSCALSSEYKAARGSVALKDSELLLLNGDTTGQPCSSFGLHHKLPYIKTMYDTGDLSFLANTGVLTEPVNIDTYKRLTLTQLFAHNSMTDEVGRLDPRETETGTGALGRMVDALEAKGYKTGRTSVEETSLNLASRSPSSPSVVTVDEEGVSPLIIDPPSLDLTIEILNGGLSGSPSGVFGETWSKILGQSRNQTDELYTLLGNTPTQTQFADTRLGRRLSLVAQLIASREGRGVDRDFFFVPFGGFDTHETVAETLDEKFTEMNQALEDFVTELKLLGVWDDVVIIQSSEFGRTLTPNSGGGTDHAWGGNYVMAGGNVKGGRILGDFPSTLDPEKSIGRGRIIPTTPWDSVFNAIGNWLGLDTAEELKAALPNRINFPSLLTASDLFN